MNEFNKVKHLRFWCEKILPLVYDDSLSYYEVICKVSQKLNEVISDINAIPNYIDGVIDEKLSDEHLTELIRQAIAYLEGGITQNNEGDNTNFSKSYERGEVVWWNDKLYILLKNVDAGATILATGADPNVALIDFETMMNTFTTTIMNCITANDEGVNTNASRAYTKGEWIWLDEVLYIALSDISIGTTFIKSGAGQNVDTYDIETACKDIVALLDIEITNRQNADNTLQQNINAEATDRQNADNTLQQNINAEATDRQNADNTLQQNINTEISNREYADSILNGFIAAREIKQSFRKYLLIFDSYGGLGVSALASEVCTGGYHVLNVGGAGFVGNGGGETWGDAFTTYVSSLTPDERLAFTDIMIFGGVNDYAYDTDDIVTAMTDFNNVKETYLPHCLITLCPVSWATRVDNTISYYVEHTIPAYSIGSTYLKWKYVNGLNAFIHCDEYMQSDGIHPTGVGCERLGNAIANFIKTGVKPKLTTPVKVATFTPVSGTSNSVIETLITEDVVRLIGYIICVFSTPISIPTSALRSAKLGTLSGSYFQGNVVLNGLPANTLTTPAYVHNTNTNAWELHTVTLQFYYFGVYICIEGPAITIDAIQTPVIELEGNLDMA